ncbi:MAG TPA: hypothetical protein VK846_19730 [Candidatus Limnocylindria bacterium]|nr:hypothetical protein [Candidatus Limnocylindria bacterium]
MNQPGQSLSELIRETNAQVRALFEELAIDPTLSELKPTLDKTFVVVVGLLDVLGRLTANSECIDRLIVQYGTQKPTGCDSAGRIQLVTTLNPQTLPPNVADEYSARKNAEEQMLGERSRVVDLFTEVAPALYGGPLCARFRFLIPIIADSSTPEQLEKLTAQCPSVPWLKHTSKQ